MVSSVNLRSICSKVLSAVCGCTVQSDSILRLASIDYALCVGPRKAIGLTSRITNHARCAVSRKMLKRKGLSKLVSNFKMTATKRGTKNKHDLSAISLIEFHTMSFIMVWYNWWLELGLILIQSIKSSIYVRWNCNRWNVHPLLIYQYLIAPTLIGNYIHFTTR